MLNQAALSLEDLTGGMAAGAAICSSLPVSLLAKTSFNRSSACKAKERARSEGTRTAILIQKVRGLRSKANSARSEQKYCKAITNAVVSMNS